MDIDTIAQAIFDALDNRGCFNGLNEEIQAEILKEIGDIIEQMG